MTLFFLCQLVISLLETPRGVLKYMLRDGVTLKQIRLLQRKIVIESIKGRLKEIFHVLSVTSVTRE